MLLFLTNENACLPFVKLLFSNEIISCFEPALLGVRDFTKVQRAATERKKKVDFIVYK